VGTLGRERVYQEAWEATRVQLAQHLPSKEFGIIAGYYSNLMKLKEAASKSQEPRRPFGHRDNSPELVRELRDRGQKAEQVIKKYVPDVMVDKITARDVMLREQGRGAGPNEGQEH
jgi:hypothetical protein